MKFLSRSPKEEAKRQLKEEGKPLVYEKATVTARSYRIKFKDGREDALVKISGDPYKTDISPNIKHLFFCDYKFITLSDFEFSFDIYEVDERQYSKFISSDLVAEISLEEETTEKKLRYHFSFEAGVE